MYGVNVKDSGMLGLGMQKYVHTWGDSRSRRYQKAAQWGRGAFWRVGYTGTFAGVCV